MASGQPPKRACDACRRRKVKCEAGVPTCANCSITHRICHYSTPQRRGPKPVRNEQNDEAVSPGWALQDTSVTPPHAQQDSVPLTPQSNNHAYLAQEPELIREMLLAQIAEVVPETPIAEMAHRCVNLHIQFFFPLSPICHEPTLRASIDLYLGQTHAPLSRPSREDGEDMTALRDFTLVTAVCASAALTTVVHLLPSKDKIALPFLRASRAMLQLYEDLDLECPDSSSLSIRQLHSSALQHATGQTGLSWHILSQAGLLAHRLRLHDEGALRKAAGGSPLERRLLRNNFWQLFVSDKTAQALRCRATVLHELLFDSPLTTLHDCSDAGGEQDEDGQPSLLEPSNNLDRRGLEHCAMQGFRLNRRLWIATADLVQEMGWYYRNPHVNRRIDASSSLDTMAEAFLQLTAIVDELPEWARRLSPSPPLSLLTTHASVSAQQSNPGHDDQSVAALWAQFVAIHRTHFLSSFHCAKLVVIQLAISWGLASILGLSLERPVAHSTLQVDVARDFVEVLERSDLGIVKLAAEPAVERIRWVGGVLLQVIDGQEAENGSAMVRTRAQNCFQRLMDVLVELDSRASASVVGRGGGTAHWVGQN